jgi:hypothetical protein
MVAGFWFNQDGLPIQFGVQKAIPEMGGDYQYLGPNRVFEQYISLGALSNGNGVVQVPALPSSFSGTGFPIAAGIQSMTNIIPLQTTAPVTAANSSGVLTFTAPQVYWSEVQVDCLVSANAGTGSATGIAVGLATSENAAQAGTSNGAFVQVTPNAGTQIVSLTNAAMVAGREWKISADGTVTGNASTTGVTAGNWISNGFQLPAVTNTFSPANNQLQNTAWLSAIAAGGTYTGSSGGGLLRLRIFYGVYGPIND